MLRGTHRPKVSDIRGPETAESRARVPINATGAAGFIIFLIIRYIPPARSAAAQVSPRQPPHFPINKSRYEYCSVLFTTRGVAPETASVGF